MKQKLLQDFTRSATAEELIYASGYIAGFQAKNGIPQPETIPLPQLADPVSKLLIVYATETGNAQKAAMHLAASYKKQHLKVRTLDIQQFRIAQLQKEEMILFIVSTQGDGDLPVTAEPFYEALQQGTGSLSHLSFAVLGLGDTAYPMFCHAALLLQEALLRQGAREVIPLVKADLDYMPVVHTWEQALLPHIKGETKGVPVGKQSAGESHHTGTRQYYSGVISHQVILNDLGSAKKTSHIEIELAEPLAYLPGDALGIVPKNKAADILPVLEYFQVAPDKVYQLDSTSATAYEWLEKRNIKGLSKRKAEHIAVLFNQVAGSQQTDLIDLIRGFEVGLKPRFEDLLQLLSLIPPRLYSIASAPEAHEGQVHLTVGLHTFTVADQERYGLSSDYLTALPVGSVLDFYIHPNPGFRLPDADTDIIMIGPGTGIAPFRSFLAHRDASGAEGRNWLFFGEQHFVQDFYYQTELQEWLATGTLSRLSTAFSRDQEHKVYVQHRIAEQAQELNRWIEDGAILYICGQKEPMSRDVEQAIAAAIADARQISPGDAERILNQMEAEGRLRKDVY